MSLEEVWEPALPRAGPGLRGTPSLTTAGTAGAAGRSPSQVGRTWSHHIHRGRRLAEPGRPGPPLQQCLPLVKGGDTLRLEHLRFGEDRPVYLFDLAPAGDRGWRSVSPHLCSEDCYAAVLLVRDNGILLRWSIDGPRKKETIGGRVYAWKGAMANVVRVGCGG